MKSIKSNRSFDDQDIKIQTGHVAIAAITSCTNTSNPYVLMSAGLLAKNAVERGLRVAPTVKTSLAPGSKVVTGYLRNSGLQTYLDTLGFNIVGYGCTTCIGNSGSLRPEVAEAITETDLLVSAVYQVIVTLKDVSIRLSKQTFLLAHHLLWHMHLLEIQILI